MPINACSTCPKREKKTLRGLGVDNIRNYYLTQELSHITIYSIFHAWIIQYKQKCNISTRALARLAEGVWHCPPWGLPGYSQEHRAKVIRHKTHLSYLRLTPNKHIIANIFAELENEYPGDWLCIYTLMERWGRVAIGTTKPWCGNAGGRRGGEQHTRESRKVERPKEL